MNDAPPQAVVRPRKATWKLWILPFIAAGLSALLVIAYLGERGIPITIRFEQGYGLKHGDAVKYRGITIGVVDEVVLGESLQDVQVHLRLRPDARNIAVQGSRFWIVRPQVDLSGTTGLETVVGAKYISVIPGDGPPVEAFHGLEIAPLLDLNDPGGLAVTLVSGRAGGISPGALVSYRQVPIGTILSVAFAPDYASVEFGLYIRPDYRHLIREDCRFWRTSGATVKAGLFSGLEFDVESIHSLVLGGVSLAIPDSPGEPAPEGTRFTLHDEPDDDWLDWNPTLTPGESVKGVPAIE